MSTSDLVAVGLAVLNIIFSVLLLQSKQRMDDTNKKFEEVSRINSDLYEKFNELSKEIADFKVQVVGSYNTKHEMETMFQRLQGHVDKRLDHIEQTLSAVIKQKQ